MAALKGLCFAISSLPLIPAGKQRGTPVQAIAIRAPAQRNVLSVGHHRPKDPADSIKAFS
jgi:hypothetical protein